MKFYKHNNCATNKEDCYNLESSYSIRTVIYELGECLDAWDKYRDNEFCCEEKCKGIIEQLIRSML